MEFSKTLKLLIRQRGLTTAELAKAISLSPKTISDWLVGRTPRDLEAVKRCAEYFDVSVHYLLFGKEDPKSSFGSILDNAAELHTGIYQITIKKLPSKTGGS